MSLAHNVQAVPTLSRWLDYPGPLPNATAAVLAITPRPGQLRQLRSEQIKQRHRESIRGLPDVFTHAEAVEYFYGQRPTAQQRYQLKLTLNNLRARGVIVRDQEREAYRKV